MINEKYSNSSICRSNVDYQQQNFNHLCSFLTSSFFLSIHPHINKKDCSFSIITRLYLSIPHANPSFSWKKRTKKKIFLVCMRTHTHGGARTRDPGLIRPMLYRLSYTSDLPLRQIQDRRKQRKESSCLWILQEFEIFGININIQFLS